MKSKEERILQLEEDLALVLGSFKDILDQLSGATRRESELIDRITILEKKLGIKGK